MSMLLGIKLFRTWCLRQGLLGEGVLLGTLWFEPTGVRNHEVLSLSDGGCVALIVFSDRSTCQVTPKETGFTRFLSCDTGK